MKKRTKQLILAAAAVVLLSGVFLISSASEKKKAAAEAAAKEAEQAAAQEDFDYTVFIDIPSEEMVRIEMIFPGQELVLEKDGETWNLVRPRFDTVQAAVDAAVSGVSGVGSSTIVEENVSDWSVYGLGPEAGHTTVTSSSGKKETVVVGDRTPTGSGYYARVEGNPNAYMMYTRSAENLIPLADRLRDRSLPQIDLQKLTYIKAEGDRTMELVPTYEYEAFASSFSSLLMVQPYEQPSGISMDKLGRFVEAMNADPLRKKNFVDEYSSLADLGLDEGSARKITYRDQDNNSVSLIIGKAVTNEEYVNSSEQPGQYIGILGPRREYYAKLPGGRDVFTVSGAWAGLVETDPFSLRDGFVRLVNIDDIASFSFSFKGQIWGGNIVREGEGEEQKISYFLGGEPTEEDSFKDVYQDCLYIIYEGEADPAFKLPKIAPEATLSYVGTESHGGSTRADFYPYDNQYYIVSVDGMKADFLVGRYQVEDVVKNLKTAFDTAP